jgi:hypothetical protein
MRRHISDDVKRIANDDYSEKSLVERKKAMYPTGSWRSRYAQAVYGGK